MMSVVEEKLKQLGLTLPEVPPSPPFPADMVRVGSLAFLSGIGPRRVDGTPFQGKLGKDLTVEDGYQAARYIALAMLARLQEAVGDLDKVKRIVKVLAMFNADPGFTDLPAAANGCSELLVDLYGERGHHARSAVGMSALPNNIVAEIEFIVEFED